MAAASVGSRAAALVPCVCGTAGGAVKPATVGAPYARRRFPDVGHTLRDASRQRPSAVLNVSPRGHEYCATVVPLAQKQ